MNISRTKILIFFITTLILGWFLYPREIFMAYIQEGKTDLEKAEKSYLEYLKQNPTHKETMLKLTDLYERMGSPKKARPYYSKLFDYRKSDWNLALDYLDFLERIRDNKKLYDTRLEVVTRFKDSNFVEKKQLLEMLETAYEYALFNQDNKGALEILKLQEQISPNELDYVENKLLIFKANKQVRKLLNYYNQRLQEDPGNQAILLELFDIYMAQKSYDRALKVIRTLARLDPSNIDYLFTEYNVLLKTNQKDEAEKVLQAILQIQDIEEPKLLSAKENLAALYRLQGQTTKALQIYTNLASLYPANEEYIREMIYILLELNQTQAALPYIQAYLKQYPDDFDMLKVYLEHELYVNQSLNQLALFQNYIQETKDFNMMMDVAYLLIDKNNVDETEQWLEKWEPYFSQKPLYQELRATNLIEQQEYAKAEPWLFKLTKHRPNQIEWFELLILSYRLQNKRTKAHNLLQALNQTHANSLKWQQFIGESYVYMSWLQHSKKHFFQALKISDSPEPKYFLSEVFNAMGQREYFHKYAKDFLKQRRKLPQNKLWKQRILLTKSKLKFKKSYQNKLLKMIQDNPKDYELIASYANLLMDQRKIKDTETFVYNHFPKIKNSQLLSAQARLYVLQKNFDQAIDYYKQTLKFEPDNIYVQNDLAQALNQKNKWKEALNLLENIQIKDRAHYFIADNKQNIWLTHHDQIGTEFHFVDQNQVSFYETTTDAKFHLNEKLQAHLQYTHGFYDDDTRNHTGIAKEALLGLTSYHIDQTSLELMAGYGQTGKRKTPSFFAKATHQIQNNLTAELNGSVRRTRRDISQAVFSEALKDEAEINLSYLPKPWWILTASYQFTHTDLANGNRQYENYISPTISRVLWNIPFVSVGYQMAYSRADGDSTFFTSLPVIPESFAHYFNVIFRHDFNQNLTAQLQGFVGEDFKRNLSLFSGELWGTSAYLDYHMQKHLYLRLDYQFGQETLAGLGGENHDVKLKLIGHW